MNVQIIQTECVHIVGWLSTNFLLHQSAFCWFLPFIERFCESGWTTKDYRIKKAFINQTLKHKSGCRQEDMRQLSGVIREKLESYFLVEACCIPLSLNTAFWQCAIYDTVKLKMKSMTSVLKLKKNNAFIRSSRRHILMWDVTTQRAILGSEPKQTLWQYTWQSA